MNIPEDKIKTLKSALCLVSTFIDGNRFTDGDDTEEVPPEFSIGNGVHISCGYFLCPAHLLRNASAVKNIACTFPAKPDRQMYPPCERFGIICVPEDAGTSENIDLCLFHIGMPGLIEEHNHPVNGSLDSRTEQEGKPPNWSDFACDESHSIQSLPLHSEDPSTSGQVFLLAWDGQDGNFVCMPVDEVPSHTEASEAIAVYKADTAISKSWSGGVLVQSDVKGTYYQVGMCFAVCSEDDTMFRAVILSPSRTQKLFDMMGRQMRTPTDALNCLVSSRDIQGGDVRGALNRDTRLRRTLPLEEGERLHRFAPSWYTDDVCEWEVNEDDRYRCFCPTDDIPALLNALFDFNNRTKLEYFYYKGKEEPSAVISFPRKKQTNPHWANLQQKHTPYFTRRRAQWPWGVSYNYLEIHIHFRKDCTYKVVGELFLPENIRVVNFRHGGENSDQASPSFCTYEYVDETRLRWNLPRAQESLRMIFPRNETLDGNVVQAIMSAARDASDGNWTRTPTPAEFTQLQTLV